MQKRLGDGFYEQKLIREQVLQLTGRRFLDGHANDEAQYQALMNRGATVAREWGLIPGVALSAEQIAQLTSDIVWLVEQTATLADGSSQQVLVPQLYVSPRSGDLDGSGSLLSGAVVNLQLTGNLLNSGTVAGRSLVRIDADTIQNLGGTVAGTDVALSAQQDLVNRGGSIRAEDSLIAQAGHDLVVESTPRGSENTAGASSFSQTAVERVAGLYVSNPGAVLVASAGHDLSLTAAVVQNSGAGGQTVLAAGHDLSLSSVTTSRQNNVVWDANNHLNQGHTQDIGSVIQTQGDLSLTAGNDLAARAAQISSQAGAIDLQAGRNVSIEAGEASQNWSEARHSTRSGVLSSTTVTNLDETRDSFAVASSVSGHSVAIQAGRDLQVTGSNVVSDAGTTLAAGHDIAIEAATQTHSETHYADKVKSGLMGTGGIGFTLGTRQQTSDQQGQSTSAAASTVGSTGGNVTIDAGHAYTQAGSDVLAPAGDIAIAAQNVAIIEARQASQSRTETQFKQSGLTVALTSPVISAVQTVQQMSEAARRTDDGRMQALAAGTAALAVKNAADAIQQTGSATGGLNISITVGSSSSQSNQTQTSDTAAGSTVAAGGNVDIRATSAGAAGDLTVRGSEITAGNNVSLTADDEINLLAAQNTYDQHRTSSSQSGAVGVAISYGADGFAAGVTASASASRGHADGADLVHSDTHVQAGNTLTLESGGDTTLRGAVASGNQVVADVGGNLNIASLQDTSRYDSQDQSFGGSVTVGYGFSASVNASRGNIHSDYASVAEQSAIHAGDGGFQIEVAGNTDLAGGAITSTQVAIDQDRNRLTTGTLTTRDIRNRAEYSASSAGIGAGYTSQDFSLVRPDGSRATPAVSGVGTDQQGNAQTGAGQTPGSTLASLNGFSATAPVAMSASGDAGSVTKSGISAGNVTLTDEAGQQQRTGQTSEQTLASLNRDLITGQDSSNALAPIFNEQAIQTGFEIVGALSREVGTFLNNRAQESTRAEQVLREERAKPESEQDPAKIEAARQTLEANQTWAMGGSGRIILTAVTAAASGNVTGSGTELIQGAAVNYLQSLAASEVKHIADNLDSEAARTALQGLTACAGAAAQGQSCGAGASGAAASVVINNLLDQATGQDGARLTPEEKEARLNLVNTLITGIAVYTGAEASTATAAATIESENNSLIKGAKIVLKTTKAAVESYKKNGKVKLADLKQTLKDEGLSIADNLLTLADGELTVDDALAIIDLVVGTEFNRANRGEAAKKIAEIERKYAGGSADERIAREAGETATNNAANRATHEVYKDDLLAAMEKPAVSDKALSSIVDKLYRPNATVGSGSTAAAVREELATGQPVGGLFHSQKARDSIIQLERWLDRNPTANPGDRAAAENMIRDLSNALRGR